MISMNRLFHVLVSMALLVGAGSAMADGGSALPQGYGPRGPAQMPAPTADVSAAVEQARRGAQAVSGPLARSARDRQAEIMKHLFGERSQALSALGLSDRKTGYLYIFVSESLPASLLRAYARDAAWTGGVFVFNGINPKHSMGWFMRHVMAPLRAPTASASMALDPRLFDTYGVTAVPTIVYTTLPPMKLCRRTVTQTVNLPGYGAAPWRRCKRANPKTYWKMSGAVSTIWALRAFRDAGAPGVSILLKAAGAGGLVSGRKQSAISNDDFARRAGPGALDSLMDLLGPKQANTGAAPGEPLPLGVFPGSSAITLPSADRSR